jgi:hypothetical protein
MVEARVKEIERSKISLVYFRATKIEGRIIS